METWNQICARLSKLHFTCSEDYFDKQIVFQRVLSKFNFSLRPKTISTLGQRQSADSPKLDFKSWDEHFSFSKFSPRMNEHRFYTWKQLAKLRLKKYLFLWKNFLPHCEIHDKRTRQTPRYFPLSKLIEAAS